MTLFKFDADAALARFSESQTPPTLPTLPTDYTSGLKSVGTVGSVGTVRSFVKNASDLTEAINHYEERAAIREFDGGQPRIAAEAAALIETSKLYQMPAADLRAAIDAHHSKSTGE